MFRKQKSPRFLDSVTEFQFANKSVILYIQRQLKNSRVRISRISRAEDIELVAKYNSRCFVEQYQGHQNGRWEFFIDFLREIFFCSSNSRVPLKYSNLTILRL